MDPDVTCYASLYTRPKLATTTRSSLGRSPGESILPDLLGLGRLEPLREQPELRSNDKLARNPRREGGRGTYVALAKGLVRASEAVRADDGNEADEGVDFGGDELGEGLQRWRVSWGGAGEKGGSAPRGTWWSWCWLGGWRNGERPRRIDGGV